MHVIPPVIVVSSRHHGAVPRMKLMRGASLMALGTVFLLGCAVEAPPAADTQPAAAAHPEQALIDDLVLAMEGVDDYQADDGNVGGQLLPCHNASTRTAMQFTHRNHSNQA